MTKVPTRIVSQNEYPQSFGGEHLSGEPSYGPCCVKMCLLGKHGQLRPLSMQSMQSLKARAQLFKANDIVS